MTKTEFEDVAIPVSAVVLSLAAVFAFLWFTASVQKDVYQRQGVDMTTFEVFMGAKPVERYVKENK